MKWFNSKNNSFDWYLAGIDYAIILKVFVLGFFLPFLAYRDFMRVKGLKKIHKKLSAFDFRLQAITLF